MIRTIIPVAGIGTKLRPHTHTQPKPLIPVAGKPILGHIVDSLIRVGLNDFVFIVGYLGEKIEQYILENYGSSCKVDFVKQEPREGIAHALWLSIPKMQDQSEILIALGDTIIDIDSTEFLKNPYSVLAVDEVENPRLFGVAALDEEGFINHLVEKPTIPRSNLALVGWYKIKEVQPLISCIQYLIENQLRTHTEYHLTDALMLMVNQGIKIRTHRVNRWFDCGKKDSLLLTNRILLEKNEKIHPGVQVNNSIIINPVSLSEGVKITDSIVGPFVAVGENVVVEKTILSDSIIGSYSRLESIILKHSVVGNDATLKGKSQSVNIGDSTEIDFNE